MGKEQLLAAWLSVAEWAAYDLFDEGNEAVVLRALGRFPRPATVIVQEGFRSPDYRRRKLTASLAGWIQSPPPGLLAELFRLEIRRDQGLPETSFQRLDCQSVVEDIVFSGARWMRDSAVRASASELLIDVVERTIGSSYWNSSSYAITILCKHDWEGNRDLLRRFQSFANTGNAQHPSNPSLMQERGTANKLLNRDSETLNSIESLLHQRELNADSYVLQPSQQEELAELLKNAERFPVS